MCGGDRAPAVTLERFDDAMRADVAARVALEIVARRPRDDLQCLSLIHI
uniref:Uncharacterized protein n=1 Tax=Ralstonia solanacearum TaxID=305 RepID=A0A0S4UGS7_RALSL|nr:protein of unknown function [Ralstonia solanacearum]